MKLTHNKLSGDILALDIGTSRTGVARINTVARIAEALDPITESDRTIIVAIEKLIAVYEPVAIVLGLPRGLDGQETEQTTYVRTVHVTLKESFPLQHFYMIDEAGTTKEAELRARVGESIDSVAAGIIGEDFIEEIARGNIDGLTL